ncbi:membrane protease YdiL (CAAX protease family) [Chryseobacterium ginsenosidimutans]|uniref:CPBP family intramembrane glutamic endopeptidase n=1 Tax=Chryseobacterium ginsenosidimutans TaxID=687846 RepID=UPI002784D296|nr:CPBP family intramembrane glutamic endopeptidase [Chryseobacterium ginsenosidimutans]MDQ0595203.1 membrane protease YdiL (CAAX protease family) [Chryseobacterium ginsenosidimutans]
MNQEIKSSLIRVLPFLIILIVLLIATKKKKIEVEELYLRKPNSIVNFLFWAMGFFLFVLCIEFALSHFGILDVNKWNHPFLPSVIRIFGAVILAPIAEELVFRGLILSKLINRKLNIHLAVFIQACVFVLLHNFTYENTLSSNIGIAQSFVDASLFGYARLYTRSIYTSIAMHITGNFIATIERFIL